MITVYRWDLRYPGSATGFRVGHVSLRVTGGTPAGDIYMSWFPTEHGSLSSPARRGQTFEQDVHEEGTQPLDSLRVGTEQKTLDETAMKAWWARFLQNPPQWSLYDTNCSQLVIEALRAGGSDRYLGGATLGVPPWRSWSVVWRPWQIPAYIAAVNKGLAQS